MKLKAIQSFGMGAAANIAIAITFGLTCISLYSDRTATAGVAAALTLALVLFRQLPILESFEVLSLKAKFTARIGEADTLLAHIRRNVSASSKLSYVQLAFMNRMGDIGWSRKRELLEEIDGLLRQVEISEGDIAAMKAPFLNLVTLDLSRIYEHSVRELLQPARDALDREINDYSRKPIPAGDLHLASLHNQRKALDVRSIDWGDSLGNKSLSSLRSVLSAWTADIPIGGSEVPFAEQILGEVAGLSEACWRAGTVTIEAEEYLGKYSGYTHARLNAIRQPSAE